LSVHVPSGIKIQWLYRIPRLTDKNKTASLHKILRVDPNEPHLSIIQIDTDAIPREKVFISVNAP